MNKSESMHLNNIEKKVFILNDTHAREPEHLGCELVMNNLFALCKQHSLEIIGTEASISEDFSEQCFKNKIKNADCIIVNGEGTLHDNAGIGILRRVQIGKEMKKKIFLINAVWQNNSQTKQYLNYFDLICVRENTSLTQIKIDGAENAFCVPDLSFYTPQQNKPIRTKKAKKKLICLDNVIIANTNKIYQISKMFKAELRFMHKASRKATIQYLGYRYYLSAIFNYRKFRILNNLKYLRNFNLMISGRFHGLCIAMKLGIPCIAMESNTHKVEAILKDANLDLEKYFIPQDTTIPSFKTAVSNFINMDHTQCLSKYKKYTEDANTKIEWMFQTIKKLS